MIIAVWTIVAAVTIMRGIAAFTVPLTGDEAYYWEWSRHLAFGYTDHPPMVAWTIALFSFLGTSPGAVRFGFVVCGVVATLAIAACATQIADGDRRAGAVAALAFSLMPAMSLAFGSASPDGPYLAFWCLALWLAARAFDTPEEKTFAFLGLALGGAILSRMTAFALLVGVVAPSGSRVSGSPSPSPPSATSHSSFGTRSTTGRRSTLRSLLGTSTKVFRSGASSRPWGCKPRRTHPG